MKLSVLKPKRNNLTKYAGKYFVDETSETVKNLNAQGKRAIVGIQNRKGVYTIIGEQFVYYLTASGKSGEISLNDFIEELSQNGWRIGSGYLTFKFMYRNIVLSNTDKVWLNNSETMFALWSAILWLRKNPGLL